MDMPTARRRLARLLTRRPIPYLKTATRIASAPDGDLSVASRKTEDGVSPCQNCGACCAYSRDWPRFTIEDDAALDLIPARFVNARLSGMRCEGERCAALVGRVGEATSCAVYAVRPEVCRVCMPGDAECAMARRRHGLPALPEN